MAFVTVNKQRHLRRQEIMKARIPQFQEGLDFFCENESWAAIYNGAPDGEKEELELKFYAQWRDSIGKPLTEEEYLKLGDLCVTPKKKADWEYALMFAKDPRQVAFYRKCIAKATE